MKRTDDNVIARKGWMQKQDGMLGTYGSDSVVSHAGAYISSQRLPAP